MSTKTKNRAKTGETTVSANIASHIIKGDDPAIIARLSKTPMTEVALAAWCTAH